MRGCAASTRRLSSWLGAMLGARPARAATASARAGIRRTCIHTDCVIATQCPPTGPRPAKTCIPRRCAISAGYRGLTLGDPVAIFGDELAEELLTCPLLQQAGGRGTSATRQRACGSRCRQQHLGSLVFPCWLQQRGFFVKRFLTISPGV